MTYDPNADSHTTEEIVELDDGNKVSMRLTVQDGAVVAGSFTSSPGYALKATGASALPWDKTARSALRAAPKEDEG